MDSGARVPQNVVTDLDDGEKLYYVCRHQETVLVERIDSGKLGPPRRIGSALPETHGSYVALGETRAFYCLNDQKILQDFNLVGGKWQPGSLATLGAVASPTSEIAAAATDEGGVYVFFQDGADHIQSVYLDKDGTWRFTPGFPQTPAPKDTSIFALSLKDKIHFFYVHQNKSIHVITLDKGNWTETQVTLTDTDDEKKSVRAAPSDGEIYGVEYTNDAGEVYIIDSGERVLQRRHTDDGVKNAKGAEGYNGRSCQLYYRPRWWW